MGRSRFRPGLTLAVYSVAFAPGDRLQRQWLSPFTLKREGQMTNVQIEISDADRERFVRQALREGMTLSGWLYAVACERR